jgi:GNAT superfamily N-acetyltransferase
MNKPNAPTRKLLADVLQIDKIGIRPAHVDDLGYVIDTMGRSLRPEYPDMRTSDFAGWIRARISRVLDAGAEILIAHDGEAPELIRGYVVFDPTVLHYLFIRAEFRGEGLGRRLLEATGLKGELVCTHLTAAGRRYKASHNMRFVPLA